MIQRVSKNKKVTELRMETISSCDPRKDALLETGNRFTVIGIRTCDFEVVQYPGIREVVFRVMIQTTDSDMSHILLEIFAGEKHTQPKFSNYWETNQLVIAKNCSFFGIKVSKGLQVYNFKMKSYEPDSFLWISNDRYDFWHHPFEDSNPLEAWANHLRLDHSKFSIFGPSVEETAKNIRVGTLKEPSLIELSDFRFSFFNFVEKLVIVDGLIVHPAIRFAPPMQMYVFKIFLFKKLTCFHFKRPHSEKSLTKKNLGFKPFSVYDNSSFLTKESQVKKKTS